MVESIKIIQQALEGIPGGAYENFEIAALIEKMSHNGMILNIDSLIKNRLLLLTWRNKNFMSELRPPREN